MKKLLALTLVLAVIMIGFVSCASSQSTEGEKMLKKLHKIKSDWTDEQVIDLLGEPDRYGELSVVYELFYRIDPMTEATIAFWSQGIKITVTDCGTGEETVILDVNE